MELSPQLLESLKVYKDKIKKDVSFLINDQDHPKKESFLTFLNGIASIFDKLDVRIEKTRYNQYSPLTFEIASDDQPTGILFSGIPGGHEFNSLILGTLQAGGSKINLDESLIDQIKQIDRKINFETLVSLSCENCPDVVQNLNQFALISKNITNHTIDGNLYPKLVKERDVQSVPSVFVEGEMVASGRISTANIIKKLVERGLIRTKPKKSKLPIQDVVVIGGGPAGVSSAIYAARKGLNVSIVSEKFGGQLTETVGIENFISNPYTTGKELTSNLFNHAKEYDIILKEHVQVEKIGGEDIKSITLSSGEKMESRSVIIATGAKWRNLNIPGEKEYLGKGVAYCPHCDGPFFKGKDVVVVGAGNSGLEAALDLSNIAKTVTVLEFLPFSKADKILRDKARDTKNIEIILNVETQKILGDNKKVTGIRYIDKSTQDVYTSNVSAIFIQIGLIPNSHFVKNLLDLNKYGEIITNDRCETSVKGIFAGGDVSSIPHKQIIVSMGHGATAALSASEYLIKQNVDNGVAKNTEKVTRQRFEPPASSL
ncbi:MAG: alkyl hydroperoxide reductase subunit F [Candidatus Neomarinimicrobiota bacterium]|nr:alkyl hydroperoxide reductase subunit F [Candidatus Neomarinimicrobiota bacterium]